MKNFLYKGFSLIILILINSLLAISQNPSVTSPNGKITVEVAGGPGDGFKNYSLQLNYTNNAKTNLIMPCIDLGLVRSDQEFAKNLKLIKAGKPVTINEEYTAKVGKRSHCKNSANEVVFSFENPAKAKMNVIIRAYDDGLAFRYEFPDKEGTCKITDELTSYTIADSTQRWLQKFNPANEGLYSAMIDGNEQKDWAYPSLFNTPDKNCWYLLHEADLDRTYCGTKLTNYADKNKYKLTFPDQWNGREKGDVQPTISLPWKSPWRVVVMGSLADIVESTLVDDVSTPTKFTDTEWIKPGKASWNYWSDNHGTKSYKTVCAFADLAAAMDWPYTLLDWEWDAMGDGGNLEDALEYIQSLGIKPLIWYNSGGDHTWVTATPMNRMLTHENRVEEFTKLKQLGIVGVKVDFFESEKQDMINYYLDIVEDAAKFQMMVYFHGCLVPRGWQRTYPNLMTYEGVRGAEWYNNGPEFTTTAPSHNTTLPFTRNVVGSMDYTPVTFTNSQYAHITSYGHELALSVIFESGVQHLADRPEGYYNLPEAVMWFLKTVPNTWDDTKLLDGYPGKYIVMARQKGDDWYIAGINSDKQEKNQKLNFGFLPENTTYKYTLIADGGHDKAFSVKYGVADNHTTLDINMLRRGGFVIYLNKNQ